MVLDGLSFGISLLEAIEAGTVYAAAIGGCVASVGIGCGPALTGAVIADMTIANGYGMIENWLGVASTGLTAYNDGWLLGNTGNDSTIGNYVGKDTVVSGRNMAVGWFPESFLDLGVNSSQLLYDVQRMSGAKSGGYLQSNEVWSDAWSKDWLWR
jgi:hypothetical protein